MGLWRLIMNNKYTEIKDDSVPSSTSGSRIAKGSAFGLTDLLGSLLQLPETISNSVLQPIANYGYRALTGNEFPFEETNKLAQQEGYDRNILQKVPELLGINRESFAPQNLTEKTLQNILSQAPLAGAGVLGSGAKAIGHSQLRNILGNLTRSGLESIDAPEEAQLLGQLGTEFGYSKALRGATPKALSGHKRNLYTQVGEVGEKFKSSSAPLNKVVKDLEYTAAISSNSKIKDPITRVLETLDKATPGGQATLRDFWEIKKDLGGISRDTSVNGVARAKIGNLASTIDKEILKKSNPEFLSKLNPADQFHTVENMKTITDSAIDLLPKSDKIRFLPVWNRIQSFMSNAEKTVRALKYPEVVKHFSQIATNAIRDNVPGMIKYSRLLNKDIDRIENNGYTEIS